MEMQHGYFICNICKSISKPNVYTVREMMFDLREEFQYFECKNCGCLQISQVPIDSSKYYPLDYYSFQPLNIQPQNNFLRFCSGLKLWFSLKTQVKKFKSPILLWLKKSKTNLSSKILDVGCGNGRLLFELYNLGLRNLYGTDPFTPENNLLPKSIKICKNLEDHSITFNVIMLHHTLEHIHNQYGTLLKLRSLLETNGRIIIRIPIISSYAWRKYNVNWVQLDAPRHYILHSIESMKILCSQVGFIIEEIIYDSTIFQFWGSELYKKDIPYRKAIKEGIGLFTAKEESYYLNLTDLVNKSKDGDQAFFILKINYEQNNLFI